MEYNTSRDRLIYPEYGRNIQKLAYKISSIKNNYKKKIYIKNIIKLMININSNIKNHLLNYKKKIWIQLFFLSKKRIKIKKKYKVKKEILYNKLNNLNFIKRIKFKNNINNNSKYKYYGNNTLYYFKKKIKFNKIKILYIYYMANYMKRNYLKWNKIKFVDDFIIFKDINYITKGKINLLDFFYKKYKLY
ncbi:MAG: DUF4290 domain-containing protein [Candidatus Shikimatogenerans sp. JK-2022]|nr:DUF4290 domain-containing protein [Candidatus Shikimatogenerans bostrichidophilus]